MRYILQIVTMLSDILIIGVSAYAIYVYPFNLLIWLLVICTFKTWHEQGGFIAWKLENIRRFMFNTKKYGL